MEMTQYPLIVALSWLFCEGLKSLRVKTAWLPLCAAVFGMGLAIAAHFFCPMLVGDAGLPMACIAGAVSGLAATGANEAVKKLFGQAYTAVTERAEAEKASENGEEKI